MDEEDTRDEFRGNDPPTLGDLFHRHEKALLASARRLTLDRQMAEDAVQHTFLKLWTLKDRYSPDANWDAIVRTIFRSQLIDLLRKERGRRNSDNTPDQPSPRPRRPNSIDPSIIASCPDLLVADPPVILDDQEFEKALQECIQHLPPQLREVIRLRVNESRQNNEVAGNLAISAGHASKLYFQAVESIGKCLTAKGFVDPPTSGERA